MDNSKYKINMGAKAILSIFACTVSFQLWAQPQGDNCSNPININLVHLSSPQSPTYYAQVTSPTNLTDDITAVSSSYEMFVGDDGSRVSNIVGESYLAGKDIVYDITTDVSGYVDITVSTSLSAESDFGLFFSDGSCGGSSGFVGYYNDNPGGCGFRIGRGNYKCVVGTKLTKFLRVWLSSASIHYYLVIDRQTSGERLSSYSISVTSPQQPNNQDCKRAIPLCSYTYIQEYVFTDDGNFPNEVGASPTCAGGYYPNGETHGIWYKFNAKKSGNLKFIIRPFDLNDDYNFALFDMTDLPNLTEKSCSNIGSMSPVSSNSSLITGISGITRNGGGINYQCTTGSTPYNSTYAVEAGHFYYLNINYDCFQCDPSCDPTLKSTICYCDLEREITDGYILSFEGSTPDLFYTEPPIISSALLEKDPGGTTCELNFITIDFSKAVLASSVNATDFLITDGASSYTVSNVYPSSNPDGEPYTSLYRLQLNSEVKTPGVLKVEYKGLIYDQCGKPTEPGLIEANFSYVQIEVTVERLKDCEVATYRICAPSFGGATSDYEWYKDGKPYVGTNGLQITGQCLELTTPGNYSVTFKEANNCKKISAPVTIN